MSEHRINLTATHELRGSFTRELIGSDRQMELEFHKQKSELYECVCGERFYKQETAEQHLIDKA